MADTSRDNAVLEQLTKCYDDGYEHCATHGSCKHHFINLIADALAKLNAEDVTNIAHMIECEGAHAGSVLWEYSRRNWPGEV